MAPICPYCRSTAKLVDSSLVYNGRSYGPAWVCANYPKCDSYVGCHKGTDKPLGRMANKELRVAKSAAHKSFDALWERRVTISKCSKKAARTRGYWWLAHQLDIPARECHIRMMDVDLCRRVVEVCKPFTQSPKPNGAK